MLACPARFEGLAGPGKGLAGALRGLRWARMAQGRAEWAGQGWARGRNACFALLRLEAQPWTSLLCPCQHDAKPWPSLLQPAIGIRHSPG